MRILIATDFSPSADSACALVGGLSLPAGAAIRVVSAIEPVPDIATLAPLGLDTTSEAVVDELREELDRVIAPLRAPGRRVESVLRVGRPADIVVGEARAFNADLVVIGSRGRGALTSAVLGSVSAEVVDRAPCPVLVVRRPTLRRLVLADDGSESAELGAALIAASPVLSKIPVRVVSVVDAPFPYTTTSDDGAGSYAAIRSYYDSLPLLREVHQRIAGERAKKLSAAGMAATSETREGDAATAIVEAAADIDADCVVIGSHGRTGLSRLVIGSVGRGVLFHAKCSVLVTKPGASRPEVKTTRELVGAAT